MIYLPRALTGLSLTIALVVITHSAPCQTGSHSEFELYPNGLIYADSSIARLRHMVDSLNLKHKSCDLSRTYYSYPQGRLWYVQFSSPTEDLNALRKDLDEGRPLVYLLEKYKGLVVKMDTLLLAVELGQRSKGNGWEFLVGNPDKGYELREAIKYHLYPGQWQYEYVPKGQFTDYSIYAFTAPEGLSQQAIPSEYSRYIQYVDCMIDTNTSIYLPGRQEDTVRKQSLDPKKAELETLRRQVVLGMCSQDPAPRIHALKIALLAAETNSWDVFLRAHLDILNDHFERLSDGSYAYGRRKTYLKELEALDLDVVDLMMGLSLRSPNVASNHYLGTVWRLGWAMTESKSKPLFEEKLTTMLKDDRLDEFNRGLLFMLLHSYQDHLDDITTSLHPTCVTASSILSRSYDLPAQKPQYR